MKDIPEDIQNSRKKWQTMRSMWWITHYSMGVSGIICTALATSDFLDIFKLSEWASPLLTLISAILFGCMAFLLPSRNALAYERALSMLEREILKYQYGQNYALKYAIEAKRTGESIITNKNLIGEV